MIQFQLLASLSMHHGTEYPCFGISYNMSTQNTEWSHLIHALVCYNLLFVTSSVVQCFVSINLKYLNFPVPLISYLSATSTICSFSPITQIKINIIQKICQYCVINLCNKKDQICSKMLWIWKQIGTINWQSQDRHC